MFSKENQSIPLFPKNLFLGGFTPLLEFLFARFSFLASSALPKSVDVPGRVTYMKKKPCKIKT